MIGIDVYADGGMDAARELGRKLNVKERYMFGAACPPIGLGYLSHSHFFLEKATGDVNIIISMELTSHTWPDVEKTLLELSKSHCVFATERVDILAKTPWDYYIFEDGNRKICEIFDKDDFPNLGLDQLVLKRL